MLICFRTMPFHRNRCCERPCGPLAATPATPPDTHVTIPLTLGLPTLLQNLAHHDAEAVPYSWTWIADLLLKGLLIRWAAPPLLQLGVAGQIVHSIRQNITPPTTHILPREWTSTHKSTSYSTVYGHFCRGRGIGGLKLPKLSTSMTYRNKTEKKLPGAFGTTFMWAKSG